MFFSRSELTTVSRVTGRDRVGIVGLVLRRGDKFLASVQEIRNAHADLVLLCQEHTLLEPIRERPSVDGRGRGWIPR